MDDWKAEALEWTRGTETLDAIRDHLESGFDIALKRSSLRDLLVDLGIGPAVKLAHRDSERGRVGFYDPLVCWVVFVTHHTHITRAQLAQSLNDYRDTARKAVWGPLANTPKKRSEYDQLAWDWRVESTAYHLFISDLRHGPEPRLLNNVLDERARLLYLTLDSNMCLESVLRVYVANYVRLYAGPFVDPNDVNLFSGECDPLFNGSIDAHDTLGVLAQFGVLKAGGPRLSEPDHLYFDEPDMTADEGGDR